MTRIYFLPFWFVMQTTLTKKIKQLLCCSVCLLSLAAAAQSTIHGKVTDRRGAPVAFANVFLKNAMEGSTTDTLGTFRFLASQQGNDTLVVSFVGYQPYALPVVLAGQDHEFNVKLKDEGTQLNEIEINAGTIDATNERAVAVLRPMDIVTTAGAMSMGVAGAIQTLPGVQRNGGDQTGLFVRGGDATETLFIIDGLAVQNAFMSGPPGVGQRSRFNPFQFKGTSFSTGGYSARYGQALSSVIDLQTTDLPEKTTLSLGASFAGGNITGTRLMDNSAIEYQAYYLNFTPYYGLANTNVGFYRPPQGMGLSTRYVSKTGEHDYFKMSLTYNRMESGTKVPSPSDPEETIRFGLQNDYTLLNTSYLHFINPRLKSFTALSYSNNTDAAQWDRYRQRSNDWRMQGRTELKFFPSNAFSLLGGAEVQRYACSQKLDTAFKQLDEVLPAAYVEAEYRPACWFAVKPGVRAEYSQLLARGNVSPRLALALKLGAASQVSMASGLFYQTAPNMYLLFGYRPDFQQALHYMANYQWTRGDRTFRIEGYYKSYAQLVRERDTLYTPNPNRFFFQSLPPVDNSGKGYAQGIDVFWRDRQLFRNFDYWISYSYVDTKRLYQNYRSEATPDYVSAHNLSLVAKYFIEKIKTNISATYSYASGRPYYNPNATGFLSDRTTDYHNVAVTVSYVTTIKKWFAVFYIAADNLTNSKNVLGYRYSLNGLSRSPVLPPLYRSVFLGVNLSLSPFKKEEL